MSSNSPKVNGDQNDNGENSNEFVVVGDGNGSAEEANQGSTQQQPSIHNFAADVSSNSNNFSYPAVNINASPNFSFDSSPGGLAIAEDDDEEFSVTEKKPNPPETKSEVDKKDGQEAVEPIRESSERSGESSDGSAERSGFEVIRMQDLTLQQQQQKEEEDKQKGEEKESTNAPVDSQPENPKNANEPSNQEEARNQAWSDAGSPILQIDEERMETEPTAETNTSNITLNQQSIPVSLNQQSISLNQQSIPISSNQLSINAYSEVTSNPLLNQQRPGNEVMHLLNEQTVRELREKLEIEQRKQLAADAAEAMLVSGSSQLPNVENSKISMNALYSLNNGGRQIPQIPQATQNIEPTNAENQLPKRREAYRWTSNLPIFAMGWSYKRYPNQRLRLACSSIRDGHELLKNTMSIVEFDEEHGELTERTQVFIGAPSCELKFIPTTDPSQPDLIASATRELRIYSYHTEQQEVVLEAKLSPNKSYAYAGPLTSVDWNEMDPRIIGGSSIDSTCTIWDIEAQAAIATVPSPTFGADQQRLKYSVQTQLIAHERPVHDMAFSRLGTGREYFASCGADGSVRLFDLRNLKNSTILYEHPDKNKLNHISWNKVEPAQFVIVADSSNELVICDVRMPCRPLVKYGKHLKPVNSVDWAPHSASHFCSGSSDHQALIWQLQGNGDEPLLAYRSEGEITRIRWSSTYNNWIGISFANFLEILRV